MKFAILIALVSVFSFGCGAPQVKKFAEQNVTSTVCAPACAQQAKFSQEMCVSVCESAVDAGQKTLQDPTFEGVFGAVCGQACLQRPAVPPEVCEPVCNFLANSGKSLL
jgi:hypothetical protein